MREMDVTTAHAFCNQNRAQIEASTSCGCFYCTAIFEASRIKEWVDRDTTALCPECGIDAVLASASGVPLTQDFLSAMRRHWFSS